MNMNKHNFIKILGSVTIVFAGVTVILALPFLFFMYITFKCWGYLGYDLEDEIYLQYM